MPESPKNILIIKPSALGDLVQVLPSLAAMRKQWPDAKIKWLVRNEFASLIQGHPYLDEVILFDRKFLGKCWKNTKAFGALISLIKRLRKEKFDLVLDYQGLFRTAGFAFLSGSKQRIGPANAREGANMLYTKRVKQDRETIHLVDYYLKITSQAGITCENYEFSLPVKSEAKNAVETLLKNHDINDYAVFVPGSAHADKCWPTENLAKLADMLNDKYGFSIVASGTPNENPLAESIIEKAETPVLNFTGKTNIPELVELMRNAKLVISNDTGPGHIAAALKVPLVMIFGRSNPARVAPYGREHCVAAIDYHDRSFKADSPDPRHHVNNIIVDEVFQKACAQLDNQPVFC